MIEEISIKHYGIVAIALFVVWQLLTILGKMIFKGNSDKIDDIHKYTIHGRKVLDNVTSDKYSCFFKDRDEVVLLVHAMEDLKGSIDGLTFEVRKTNGRT